MRNFLFGACFALLIVFVYQYCDYRKFNTEQRIQSSAMLQEQLKNVGKLIVTEGNFTQLHTYEDSKKYYFDALTFKKKALVKVDAKALVSYDLKQMEVRVDTAARKVIVNFIPEPELTIVPNIEYYDIEAGIFNDFDADALNSISKKVTDSITNMAKTGPIMSNARNRLISELHQIYVLTASMGWTLEYQNKVIDKPEDWQILD